MKGKKTAIIAELTKQKPLTEHQKHTSTIYDSVVILADVLHTVLSKFGQIFSFNGFPDFYCFQHFTIIAKLTSKVQRKTYYIANKDKEYGSYVHPFFIYSLFKIYPRVQFQKSELP